MRSRMGGEIGKISSYMYMYNINNKILHGVQQVPTPLLCRLLRLPELDIETFPLSMEDVDTAYCSREE